MPGASDGDAVLAYKIQHPGPIVKCQLAAFQGPAKIRRCEEPHLRAKKQSPAVAQVEIAPLAGARIALTGPAMAQSDMSSDVDKALCGVLGQAPSDTVSDPPYPEPIAGAS